MWWLETNQNPVKVGRIQGREILIAYGGRSSSSMGRECRTLTLGVCYPSYPKGKDTAKDLHLSIAPSWTCARDCLAVTGFSEDWCPGRAHSKGSVRFAIYWGLSFYTTANPEGWFHWGKKEVWSLRDVYKVMVRCICWSFFSNKKQKKMKWTGKPWGMLSGNRQTSAEFSDCLAQSLTPVKNITRVRHKMNKSVLSELLSSGNFSAFQSWIS